MEQANAFVALGGDRGNSVPIVVTPAEVEVLRRVHSDDAVHDIVLTDPVSRSKQAELVRLSALYHAPRDEDGKRLLTVMYPSHTLLPMTFEELGLGEELYKATARAVPRSVELRPQDHGRPGQEAPRVALTNTAFEPIEVPPDPETQADATGMVDPRSQHQLDMPAGDALLASDDGDLGKLKALADEQGTGPGKVPTQTGALTQGGPVATGGAKTAAGIHAEVTAKDPTPAGALFS